MQYLWQHSGAKNIESTYNYYGDQYNWEVWRKSGTNKNGDYQVQQPQRISKDDEVTKVVML